jgi:hypothetical protein
MTLIRRFLSRCFLLVEKLKGSRSIKETTEYEDPILGTLVGYSVSGYQIQVFCRKKSYRKKYARWFVPPTDLVMYHVYSIISHDAPESLKKACALEITIPRPRPEFLDDEYQKDAAIEWYLDLLIQKMSPADRFNG